MVISNINNVIDVVHFFLVEFVLLCILRRQTKLKEFGSTDFNFENTL